MVGIFRQSFRDDLFQTVRDSFRESRKGRRISFLNRDNLAMHVFAFERRARRDHFIEHDAQAPDVGAMIHLRRPCGLLRRHISNRAHHDPRLSVHYSGSGFRIDLP